MNSIVQILVGVLNSLWQAAIVAALVWLALKFARRRNLAINAATRYVVWWAALGVVLVLPAAPGALALWRTRSAHTTSSTAAPKAAQPVLPAANFDSPALITLREQRSTRWPFWVLGIWSAAFLYRLIEIARSYLYLRGVKRRAAISSQPLPEHKRSARLLLSGEVLSPMAVGFLRPAVILPETLPAEITGEEMHHVLLHEYAHLARLDDWSNLIAHVLGAVLVLHPPAWWILRQIGREREMACDDWVVARTGSARPYAASLARLSELRWSRRKQAQGEALASGILGGGSRLGERIELLLSGANTRDCGRVLGGCFAAGLVALAIAFGSTPRWIAFAQRVEFEVASIKPHQGPVTVYGLGISGTTVGELAATLAYLVKDAYYLKEGQVSGGPDWGRTQRYDIVAKAPGEREPTVEEARQMLQTLLADRFKLTVRREMHETPVYALVSAKGGFKLRPSDKRTGVLGQPSAVGRRIKGSVTMDFLARLLTDRVGRYVVDRTGLAGNYEIALEWTPDNFAPPDDTPPLSIFTAVQEQLGLKLEPAKAPVERLIIEHAEMPTEN
ncbi:MAG TPA: M56 family metallopeptidase [Bryobacteraceae bacterium]